MADFEPITSQEMFDNAIKDRINRLNDKHSKEMAELTEKYSDYDSIKAQANSYESQISTLNEKLANHDAEIAERDAKIKNYEIGSIKTKVARDLGLSYDAINFLQGEDEESIKQSAENLKALVGTKTAPSYNAETVNQNNENAAYKSMLANLM